MSKLRRLLVAFTLVLSTVLAPVLTAQSASAAYPFDHPVWASHYISQYWAPPGHKGVDIAVASGNYAHSVTQGQVIYAGWDRWGFGYMVMVRDWDGSYALYAHNSRVLVRYGQWVGTGTRLAVTGSTGNSTGPHVHLQMWAPGTRITNPEGYLPPTMNPYTYLLARGIRI